MNRADKRRMRILELKLIVARADTVMAAANGPPFFTAMKDQEEAEAELEVMRLTDEEKEL